MMCVFPAFGVPNRQMCACHVNSFGVFFSCAWSREWVNLLIKLISLAYALAALCCRWCAGRRLGSTVAVTPAARVGVFDRHTCLWISCRVKETATLEQNGATARDMLNTRNLVAVVRLSFSVAICSRGSADCCHISAIDSSLHLFLSPARVFSHCPLHGCRHHP